ncbi:hypothetical protein FNL56_09395 [Tardiphaga sp. vice304]|uniref:hypothetical protein n=1 Tax=unclassified Tardiphaga TaxID=2631404 RepID=UPI0011621ECA|nr:MULTISPECIES: hypothetical protein [unclassified Tardiphaga]QDM16070.1 hypothetical protein FNL53_09240 [Tardiphaga sp. vice278]QDM26278.1 hypothetical protein FNL56_09395 [Tardiphaga sp. vice304]
MKKSKRALSNTNKEPSLKTSTGKIHTKPLIDARFSKYDEELIALRSKIAELEEAFGNVMENIRRNRDNNTLDAGHERSSGDMASRTAHLDGKPINSAAAKEFAKSGTTHATSKVSKRIKAVKEA